MWFKEGMLFFEFRFEDADYQRHSEKTINSFIDQLKSNIPDNKRYYYGTTNKWQISIDYRRQFDELYNKHFNKSQRSLFDL